MDLSLRKKVMLFIADLSAGGAERVVSILANTWSGYESVEVIVVTLFDTKPFYELDARVHHVSLGMTPGVGRDRRAMDAFGAMTRLRAVLRRERPAFVLSFMNKYNVFCLASAIGLGIPIIVSERDSPTETGRRLNWMLRWLLYPRAAGVITQSEASRRMLSGRVRCRDVQVIANPVTPLTDPTWSPAARIVLNVGRLVDKKGQRDLLLAFASIDTPQWLLVFCGDGPLLGDLQRTATELEIADRVTFAGTVKDVGTHLGRAGIFAFPSYFEGFPNALAEALLAGLPCVSYDCPTGPAELIRDGENGYLVSVGDIEGLAARLEELMNDPEKAARLGGEATKLSSVLSPRSICAQYFNYCLARAAA